MSLTALAADRRASHGFADVARPRTPAAFMVLPAVVIILAFVDLSADRLGLSVAVALRAGAGRLHAHASSACSTSRSCSSARSSITSSARFVPLSAVGWAVRRGRRGAARSAGSSAIVAPAGSRSSASIGRLISAAVAVGAACSLLVATIVAGRLARHAGDDAVLRRRRRRACSSCSASGWRCSAPSRSAAATSSASSSSFR